MAIFLYSGPSGDQYEKFKAEHEAKEAAQKAVEVVEKTPAKTTTKK